MDDQRLKYQDQSDLTHFGFQKVDTGTKRVKVQEVFTRVTERYDLMNDIMSFGIHRLWKKFTLAHARLQVGQVVLDIASGTGDLARTMAKKVGSTGQVYLADMNHSMLSYGRRRLVNAGLVQELSYVQAKAENLPFRDRYFDLITVAFGLRNFTNPSQALTEMYRLLKPGGRLLILEFSKVTIPILRRLYDAYSFRVIPKLGRWITGEESSYQYLVESIRMHPSQEELKEKMIQIGFTDCCFYNMTAGVVALHSGLKR